MIVTLEQLEDRLDWDLDDKEKRIAKSALEDLIVDAQEYGLRSWTTAGNTPAGIKRLILKAAKRYMDNPSGYILSRAGQEQLNWSDRGDSMGVAEFTEDELDRVRELAGKATHGGITSVRARAHGRYGVYDDTIYVPVANGTPFPLYSTGDPFVYPTAP